MVVVVVVVLLLLLCLMCVVDCWSVSVVRVGALFGVVVLC